MDTVLKRIESYGIVPVISIDDASRAVPLAKALKEGGLPVAEITFRTSAGEEAISIISREMPEILVGAGTVLTTEQVDRAAAAGAKFIVSPGFNPEVVKHCLKIGLPVVPGVCTPGEMEQAIALGLKAVKFFPAEQSGGISFIRAVSAPYSMLRFIPTGGISAGNLNDYLSFQKVLACGGSWMVKSELIAQGNFAEITRLTAEAVQTMLGFELGHIGINCNDSDEALTTANMLCTMFGFPVREGNSSVFAGEAFECTKEPFYGTHGHICIKTNSILRAIDYFERRGFGFRQDSRKTDAKGATKAIYFSDEICGFAFHLVQK
jgi:2-dehydro-3-deoxyphosphogluconate aldolase/(4S)-4-hydroxy-2-oxoglutarate aldolase